MRKINLVLGIILVLCFVSNVEAGDRKQNKLSRLGDLYHTNDLRYPQKELIYPFANKKITAEELTDFMLKYHLSQEIITKQDKEYLKKSPYAIPLYNYYKQPDDTLVNKIVVPIKNIIEFVDSVVDNNYYIPMGTHAKEMMDSTINVETKAEMEALENHYYNNKPFKDIYTKDQSLTESPAFLPPTLFYDDYNDFTMPSYPDENELNTETLARITKSRELATGDKESISMRYWDQDMSVPELRYHYYDKEHPQGHYTNEGGRVVRSYEIIRDVNNQPEHNETDSWVEFGGVHKGRDYFILNNLEYSRFHHLHYPNFAPIWVRSEPELFVQIPLSEITAGHNFIEEEKGAYRKTIADSKHNTPVDLETVKKAAELDAYKEIKYRPLFHQALKENPGAAYNRNFKAWYSWDKSKKEYDSFAKNELADTLYESTFDKTLYFTNIAAIDKVFTKNLLEITHYNYFNDKDYIYEISSGAIYPYSVYYGNRVVNAGKASGCWGYASCGVGWLLLGPKIYGDALTEKLLGLVAQGKRLSPGLLIGVASGKELPSDISNNIMKESDISKSVNVDDDTFWLFQLLKDGYNYAVDKLTGDE